MGYKTDIVKNANKCIAIIGKFSNEFNESGRYFFSKEQANTENQKLSPETFFKEIKPCLIYNSQNNVIRIEDIDYQCKTVAAPCSAANASNPDEIPLELDDILFELDDSKNTEHKFQKYQMIGKDLYKKLVNNLDHISTHSNPEKTSEIIESVVATIKQIPERNHEGVESLFLEDYQLRALLLSYLTCLPKEEEVIASSIVTRFNALYNMPLTPTQELWLKDNLKQKKNNLLNTDAPNEINNGLFTDFKDYQKSLMWVQKFCRSPILHSFVFCWLTGNYDSITKRDAMPVDYDYKKAREKMGTIGIKRQKDRVDKGSREFIKKQRKQIAKAKRNALEKTTDSEFKSTMDDLLTSYEDTVMEKFFRAEFIFTGDDLETRLRKLFLTLCTTSSGTIDLEKYVAELQGLYKNYLEYIKKCFEGNRDTIQQEEASEALSTFSESFKDVVKGIFDQPSENSSLNKNDFSLTITKAFLDKNFSDVAEEITSKKQALTALKAHHNNLFNLFYKGFIKNDKTGHLLSSIVNIRIEDRNRDQEINNKVEELVSGTQAIETDLPNGQDPPRETTGTLLNPVTDETLGDVKIIEGTKRVRITPLPDAKFPSDEDVSPMPDSERPSGDKKVSLKIKLGETEINGGDFGISEKAWNDATKKMDVDKKNIDELETKFTKFADDFSNPKTINTRKQALRAFHLGNIIAGSSQYCNIDKPDLSNSLGVILEIIQHLDNTKVKSDSLDPLDEETLGKINLSSIYPIADEDLDNYKLSEIIQYHAAICESFLNDAKIYLDELNTIRKYFKVMENSDIEIQIINNTFKEYSSFCEKNIQEKIYFLNRQPTVLYAFIQAGLDQTTLQDHWQKITHYINNHGCLNNDKRVQIPLIVSESKIENNTTGIPVFNTTSISIPDGFPVIENGIQKKFCLPWITQLFTDSVIDFGKLAKSSISQDQQKGVFKLTRVDWNSDMTVAKWLKKYWEKPNEYSAAVLLLKMINLALANEYNNQNFTPNSIIPTNVEVFTRNVEQIIADLLPSGLKYSKICINGNAQNDAVLRIPISSDVTGIEFIYKEENENKNFQIATANLNWLKNI